MIGAAVVSGSLAALGILSQQGDATPTPSTRVGCHYCGIVEQIRQVRISPPDYGVSTVAAGRNEAIVMLLSALSGATVKERRTRIYEVSVRMDDGTIRAVRNGRVPAWSLGERVKIVKNRIEPLS